MNRHNSIESLSAILLVGSSILLTSCSSAQPAVTTGAAGAEIVAVNATATSFLPNPVAPTFAAPTPTEAPAALSAHGPFVLFEGDAGIWIANPDGSFLTRLSDTGIGNADLHRALSPAGDALAFIVPAEEGPLLVRMQLPSGETEVLANLEPGIPPLPNYVPDEYMNSTWGHSYLAIVSFDNVAWQPGTGELLAFVGVLEGPTSDLYILDTLSGEVTRLTDGLSEAVFPIWSPDGGYILHFGGRMIPPYDSPFFGFNHADGAWAVRLSDGMVFPQPKDLLWPSWFVGWQDPENYLFSSEDENCASLDFRSVSVSDGTETTIYAGCYDHFHAQSLENGAVLFARVGCIGCAEIPGTYLLVPGIETPMQVSGVPAWKVEWLPESGVFDADRVGLVSSDGTLLHKPPLPGYSGHPALSKAGWVAWEVVEDRKGRVVIETPEGEFRTILQSDVGALIWDSVEGTTLFIAADDGLLYAAMAPDFVPQVIGEIEGKTNQAIWVP